MAVKATIYPARFQREPVDVAAFDNWQDSEGMMDASPACRAAWEAFRGEWRDARRLDIARQPEPVPLVPEPRVVKRLMRAGRAFGVLNDGPRPLVSDGDKQAWWAFRSRVLRSDPDAWGVLWMIADGQPLPLVAEVYGMHQRSVVAMVEMLNRWWEDATVEARVW